MVYLWIWVWLSLARKALIGSIEFRLSQIFFFHLDHDHGSRRCGKPRTIDKSKCGQKIKYPFLLLPISSISGVSSEETQWIGEVIVFPLLLICPFDGSWTGDKNCDLMSLVMIGNLIKRQDKTGQGEWTSLANFKLRRLDRLKDSSTLFNKSFFEMNPLFFVFLCYCCYWLLPQLLLLLRRQTEVRGVEVDTLELPDIERMRPQWVLCHGKQSSLNYNFIRYSIKQLDAFPTE